MTASIHRPHLTTAPTRPSLTSESAPAFRTVAHYPTYVAAEQAAEHLNDLGVPVEDFTIVGRDLTPVASADRLVAWRSSGFAAAVGAVIGGLLGALLGLVGVLPPTAAYIVLSGAAIGAGLGAAVGYLRHRLRNTRGDFIGLSGVRADAYQIQVDTRHIDPRRAEHRLARYWPM